MSRYDYPDPGQDPDYCDGLSDDPEALLCLWCNEPLPSDAIANHDWYCSALCALYAEQEGD